MKFVTGTLLLAVFATLTPLDAKKRERRADVDVTVVISNRDARLIHEYYREDDRRSLPPGLQKKLARGGSLPPGWQKKMAPLPVELERQLPPLRREECRRGIIDGRVVIYNHRTMAILDVVAILGH